jgi:hypothetical protein
VRPVPPVAVKLLPVKSVHFADLGLARPSGKVTAPVCSPNFVKEVHFLREVQVFHLLALPSFQILENRESRRFRETEKTAGGMPFSRHPALPSNGLADFKFGLCGLSRFFAVDDLDLAVRRSLN